MAARERQGDGARDAHRSGAGSDGDAGPHGFERAQGRDLGAPRSGEEVPSRGELGATRGAGVNANEGGLVLVSCVPLAPQYGGGGGALRSGRGGGGEWPRRPVDG